MSHEGALSIPTGKCGKGTKLVDGVCEIEESKLHRNYLAATSAVALTTAVVNLLVIISMNSGGLNLGLGLTSVGIITFIGISVSSSIFEEHRHDHGNKKNQSLVNAMVGKGIMRKSLAASLVMTYIVLIGLSFSAGTLNDSIKGDEPKEPEVDADTITEDTGNGDVSSTGDTTIDNSSGDNVNTNVAIDLKEIGQFLKDNKQIDEVTLKKTDPTSNEMQELILAKDPETLVEYFTIVISVVIGFYFGANAVIIYSQIKKRVSKCGRDSKNHVHYRCNY